MSANLLLLGGTTEASALADRLARDGIAATFSYAGRVARPRPQPLPTRTGGFGGVDGLVDYLRAHQITHVVDATHPFAAQMSRNAHAACAQSGVPLIALTRPPWAAQPGDRWHHVADIDAAVAALDGARQRVMLAIGRMHLTAFAPRPQHFYLLRLVDEPDAPLPFPDHSVVVGVGPFTARDDLDLMRRHRIDLVVSKNAGGTAARAKIDAARMLGLPVLMIDRPDLPARRDVHNAQDVIDWLHAGTDLGV